MEEKDMKKAAAVSVGCTSLLTITPKAQNHCDCPTVYHNPLTKGNPLK